MTTTTEGVEEVSPKKNSKEIKCKVFPTPTAHSTSKHCSRHHTHHTAARLVVLWSLCAIPFRRRGVLPRCCRAAAHSTLHSLRNESTPKSSATSIFHSDLFFLFFSFSSHCTELQSHILLHLHSSLSHSRKKEKSERESHNLRGNQRCEKLQRLVEMLYLTHIHTLFLSVISNWLEFIDPPRCMDFFSSFFLFSSQQHFVLWIVCRLTFFSFLLYVASLFIPRSRYEFYLRQTELLRCSSLTDNSRQHRAAFHTENFPDSLTESGKSFSLKLRNFLVCCCLACAHAGMLAVAKHKQRISCITFSCLTTVCVVILLHFSVRRRYFFRREMSVSW